MSDVARHAGVSTATVSRVVNKTAVVDELTQRQVQEAISALRYRPNAMARGLAARSSRTVGIIINRFSSSYYGEMLDGAEGALTEQGFKMLAESTQERAQGEREAWQSLMDRQCDAVIVHSDNLDDKELTKWMTEHPRSVLMNRYVDAFPDRCIHLDNRRGGALAARYLMDKEHRHIAMVTGPTSFYEVQDRTAGFLEAFGRNAETVSPLLVLESDFREQGGYDAMVRLLEGDAAFSAVFFQNDDMAAGALEACRHRGVRVPNDVSIIGFDDIVIARHLFPKLTTIRQPLFEIGAAAGRLAHALATGSDEVDDIKKTFEAEVVERASVSQFIGPVRTPAELGRSTGRTNL